MAEQERAAAENERMLAELERAGAEDQRKAAEQARSAAESARDDAESKRAEAEARRDEAEGFRRSSFSAMYASHASMAMAEQERAAAENERMLAELGRADAEDSRKAAEIERSNAETARQQAFEARDGSFDSLQKSIRQRRLVERELYFSTPSIVTLSFADGSGMETAVRDFYAMDIIVDNGTRVMRIFEGRTRARGKLVIIINSRSNSSVQQFHVDVHEDGSFSTGTSRGLPVRITMGAGFSTGEISVTAIFAIDRYWLRKELERYEAELEKS